MYMYEYWFVPFMINLDLFFYLDEVDIFFKVGGFLALIPTALGQVYKFSK